MIASDEPRCTSCGYCAPCPQDISVGASLSYYNLYKYMKLDSAKKAFKDSQWQDGFRLDKCLSCGDCSSRCPNHLPLDAIIQDAKNIMYA